MFKNFSFLVCLFLCSNCDGQKKITNNTNVSINRYFIRNSTEVICFEKQSVISDHNDTTLFEGFKFYNSNIIKEVTYSTKQKCFTIIAKETFMNLNFIDTLTNDTISMNGIVFDKAPEIYLLSNYIYYSGDTISINAFKKKMNLNIVVTDLNFDFQIEIKSFKLFFYKNGVLQEIIAKSPIIENEIRKELLTADKNSFLIIKDISYEYNSLQTHNYVLPYLLYLKE